MKKNIGENANASLLGLFTKQQKQKAIDVLAEILPVVLQGPGEDDGWQGEEAPPHVRGGQLKRRRPGEAPATQEDPPEAPVPNCRRDEDVARAHHPFTRAP